MHVRNLTLPRPHTAPLPLADVMRGIGSEVRGRAVEVTGVTHDSAAVVPGDLFAALPGRRAHGADFAVRALSAGAAAVLTDPVGVAVLTATGAAAATVVEVPDPRGVLGEIAARVYRSRERTLALAGVTGTNGKTTLCHLLAAALRDRGPAGVLGTVGLRLAGEWIPSARTTPEASDVHALIAWMGQQGAATMSMEVSSHALALHRVDAVEFDVGVFTNLSQDHLDFHHTMADYFAAKRSLFDQVAAAVVNVDDNWGLRLAQEVSGSVTYAVHRDADWIARDLVPTGGGTSFTAVGPAGSVRAGTSLPGIFNVANALGAIATATSLGIEPEAAAAGVAAAGPVPGRMQRVADPDRSRELRTFVDYAHTPEAVSAALAAAREGAAPQSRVLAVLGCGGDRDATKRPLMGAAASAGADLVVVTDDNPRGEDPALIRAAVVAGTRSGGAHVREIGDRREAIHAAVQLAAPQDVVIVLGKGHERGQEVAGVQHDFDDAVELANALGHSS